MKYTLVSDSNSGFITKFYDDLNEEQLAAVKAPSGPVLIVAGAGTGKTRTLISRAAHLIINGAEPSRMMVCTFTLKAAREIKNRLRFILEGGGMNIWAGTFHHIGHRLLRMHGDKIGLGSDFSILDIEDAKDLLSSVLQEKKAKAPLTVNKLFSMFSSAVGTQTPLYDIINLQNKDLRNRTDEILDIFSSYTEKKIKQKVVDFDDLLALWKLALLEPSTVELFRNKFDYILVDEYQDTNRLQSDILDLMAEEHKNITVVGDDAQSIYSFRGADTKNMLSFTKRYPDAAVFKLQTNYRSVQPVLDFANDALKRAETVIPRTLKSAKGDGEKPVLLQVEDSHQEAQFICQRLWELHTEENIALSDIAVLYRTHKQGLEIQVELSKRGIPFVINGGLRLLEQAHFKDVLAFIRVLLNPSDEIAVNRLFKMLPGTGRGSAAKVLTALSSLTEPFQNHPFGHQQVLSSLYGKSKNTVASLGAFFDSLNKFKDRVPELLSLVITQYEPILRGKFENADDRMEELNELTVLGHQYKHIDDLIGDLGLQSGPVAETFLQKEEPKDMLVLSTVHQAKGLEWKVVFLLAMADGSFPLVYSFKTEEIEEERRIFHVAVTRAEDFLYMTHPVLTAPSDRQRTFRKLSRFIAEVSPDLYDKWELVVEQRN